MLQAVGELRSRELNIPMGGPFPAESIDSHTLSGFKTTGKRLRDWGTIIVSDDRLVYWTTGTMWFSLAQFRDHVLLGNNIPPGTHTTLMLEVCDLLSQIWYLEVLCDYVNATNRCCVGPCLSQSRRTFGVHMCVGGIFPVY